jgi:hypothetical protein
MDLENINIYDTVSDISNLPKTTFFSSKVQTLKDKIQPILDDFQKYFVFNKLNPEYTEYQQIFANIKSNISSISSELFMLINGIESKTDEINNKLLLIDIAIKKEKDKNRQLKKQLGIVINENNGADEMIYDFKEIYNVNYLKNWALFIGIIITIILLITLFRSKSIPLDIP